jgi:cytochrome b
MALNHKRLLKGVTLMSQKDKINVVDDSITSSSNLAKTRQVRVWDILVRFTHWTVAIGIIANLFVTEDGSEWHEYVGYTVVGLVVIRLLWGFIGTRYARFTHFFPTPTRLRRHISALSVRRVDEQHLGHNPLAALMIFSLWAVIIGLGITGYLMESEIIGNEDFLEDVHELLANSLYLLVPLHIMASIAMSYWQRQNLIKSMITGNKTVLDEPSTME